MAGVPGRADGPLHDLESSQDWRDHAHDFARIWTRFETVRQPRLRDFQKAELNAEAFRTETLFYPFGGPDILTASQLFPHQKTYVLVGLEPPGTVPDAAAIRSAHLERYLPRLRFTLESVFRRSFFVTADMDKQLRGQITDGVAPLLLVQLGRLGATIKGAESVMLDEQGMVRKRTPDAPRRNAGVAFEFTFAGESQPRRLMYFSLNLSDKPLAENRAFQAFLATRKPVATFFKSASYLPHRKDFALIREVVLANSSAVLQDDTGIPYRYIDRGVWNVQLYGDYTRPYGSFRNMVQPDLKRAFEEKGENVHPLPFYLGYGYGRAPSTLLAFRKKS
ncbi:MAG: hypothetical protein JNK87_07560 [Bryobacterales bacterium]|nr:hypothetical protein [Bryobacterales bacterium]